MIERKPIDGALRRFLDAGAAASRDLAQMPDRERVPAGRALMLKALASRESIPNLPNQVSTRDIVIAGTLTVRLYLPPQSGAALFPVLVYLHGGGWVFGSIETHDPFCRLLSGAANVIIASVEYRLAPEHPYPAALEDTRTAFDWAAGHAGEWGGDAARLALGGDSAGANLAAVVANQLCNSSAALRLRALLLLYPVVDHPVAGHPSYTENATGYGLEANSMRWFWQQYAPGISPHDPAASPLQLARMPALPPTLIATAEYDVLRDEGLAYVKKLAAAGVSITHLHSPDMHHNFPVHPGTVARFPQSDAALAHIAKWLRVNLAAGQ